jgi:hypothetical protein
MRLVEQTRYGGAEVVAPDADQRHARFDRAITYVRRRCSNRLERSGPRMIWQLLKDDRAADDIVADVFAEDEEGISGIRCPRCGWRPSPSCVWSCEWVDTPEPYFEACGTVWNTFSTRGRCPGCHHQWQWTSCLRCDEWSLHDDWYEKTST